MVILRGQVPKRHISAAMLWHSFHINEPTDKAWPIWKCECCFLRLKVSVTASFSVSKSLNHSTSFLFVLIVLSGPFQGQSLKCNIYTAVPPQKRRTVWSGSVMVCVVRLEVSLYPVLFLCLYSLSLLVIFHGQQQHLHANKPTDKVCMIWKCSGMFFHI